MSKIEKFISTKNPDKDIVGFISYCLYKHSKDNEFKTTTKPKDRDIVTKTLTSDNQIKNFQNQAVEILEQYSQLLLDNEKSEITNVVLNNIKANPFNSKNLCANIIGNFLSTLFIPLLFLIISYLLKLVGFDMISVLKTWIDYLTK
jgi:hypothetical protein